MTDQTADQTRQAQTDAAPDAPPAQPPAGAAAPLWHENDRFKPYRSVLEAKGLVSVADPVEAAARLLDMQVNADKKLGRPADQLIARPAKDQDVAAWMRENRSVFGLPEAPEGYEVSRPDSWPKDAEWDATLEGEARKIALEEGVTGRALQRMTEVYAGAVARMMTGAEEQVTRARTEMMGQLEKDWGGQMEARLVRARQAAGVVGERLGLDSEGILSLTQSLSAKTGDAAVIKLFDMMGDMMGGDAAVGMGKGSGNLGMTPAEAKARRAELMKPGSEYQKAVAANNRAELARLKPELDRLAKIAVGE